MLLYSHITSFFLLIISTYDAYMHVVSSVIRMDLYELLDDKYDLIASCGLRLQCRFKFGMEPQNTRLAGYTSRVSFFLKVGVCKPASRLYNMLCRNILRYIRYYRYLININVHWNITIQVFILLCKPITAIQKLRNMKRLINKLFANL